MRKYLENEKMEMSNYTMWLNFEFMSALCYSEVEIHYYYYYEWLAFAEVQKVVNPVILDDRKYVQNQGLAENISKTSSAGRATLENTSWARCFRICLGGTQYFNLGHLVRCSN